MMIMMIIDCDNYDDDDDDDDNDDDDYDDDSHTAILSLACWRSIFRVNLLVMFREWLLNNNKYHHDEHE